MDAALVGPIKLRIVTTIGTSAWVSALFEALEESCIIGEFILGRNTTWRPPAFHPQCAQPWGAMRVTDLIVHSIAIADPPLPKLRGEEIAELRTMIERWKPVLTP